MKIDGQMTILQKTTEDKKFSLNVSKETCELGHYANILIR